MSMRQRKSEMSEKKLPEKNISHPNWRNLRCQWLLEPRKEIRNAGMDVFPIEKKKKPRNEALYKKLSRDESRANAAIIRNQFASDGFIIARKQREDRIFSLERKKGCVRFPNLMLTIKL